MLVSGRALCHSVGPGQQCQAMLAVRPQQQGAPQLRSARAMPGGTRCSSVGAALMEGHAFRARPCWPPAAAFAAAAASSSSSSSSKTPAEQGPSGGAAAGEGPPPVRRIILLRHADSEASSSTRDHERPISLDGRREARSIARRLRELGWAPDLIIGEPLSGPSLDVGEHLRAGPGPKGPPPAHTQGGPRACVMADGGGAATMRGPALPSMQGQQTWHPSTASEAPRIACCGPFAALDHAMLQPRPVWTCMQLLRSDQPPRGRRRPAPPRLLPGSCAAIVDVRSQQLTAHQDDARRNGGGGRPAGRGGRALSRCATRARTGGAGWGAELCASGGAEAGSVPTPVRLSGGVRRVQCAGEHRCRGACWRRVLHNFFAHIRPRARDAGSLYTVAALDGQTRSHLEECIRGVACDTANFCVMCVG
jgi:hypothetical protein